MFEGHHITLARGGRPLLDSFSFHIAQGQCWGIRGPNGSGKSSFLRLLAGLLPPAAGVFQWEKKPCDLLSRIHRRRISYVGNAPAFLLTRTVAQQTSSCPMTLKQWGLKHLLHLPVSFLSQGQKQRLHLAERLVAVRPLWLLDEPTSHLDAEGKVLLREVLEAHILRGGMVCVVSHEMFPLKPTVIASLSQAGAL